MKKINIISKKFGELLVLSEHSKTRNGHERYTCLCSCGNNCNILKTHLLSGNSKSCGCKIPIGKSHIAWKGKGLISGGFWSSHVLRNRNTQKSRLKLKINITITYAWKLFLKQNGRCALSNLELRFPTKWKDKSWTASLDRIDSSKGYIKGNVQWVHKDINIIKNKYSQEYFIEMCTKIAKYNETNTIKNN